MKKQISARWMGLIAVALLVVVFVVSLPVDEPVEKAHTEPVAKAHTIVAGEQMDLLVGGGVALGVDEDTVKWTIDDGTGSDGGCTAVDGLFTCPMVEGLPTTVYTVTASQWGVSSTIDITVIYDQTPPIVAVVATNKIEAVSVYGGYEVDLEFDFFCDEDCQSCTYKKTGGDCGVSTTAFSLNERTPTEFWGRMYGIDAGEFVNELQADGTYFGHTVIKYALGDTVCSITASCEDLAGNIGTLDFDFLYGMEGGCFPIGSQIRAQVTENGVITDGGSLRSCDEASIGMKLYYKAKDCAGTPCDYNDNDWQYELYADAGCSKVAWPEANWRVYECSKDQEDVNYRDTCYFECDHTYAGWCPTDFPSLGSYGGQTAYGRVHNSVNFMPYFRVMDSTGNAVDPRGCACDHNTFAVTTPWSDCVRFKWSP